MPLIFLSVGHATILKKQCSRKSITDDVINNPSIQQEYRCLVCNLYFEARQTDLSVAERRSISYVVFNRVASSSYPANVCAVVYEKNQFSWSIDEEAKREISYDEIQNLESAARVSMDEFLRGQLYGEFGCATHYYAKSLDKKNKSPNWGKLYDEQKTRYEGGAKKFKHRFFKMTDRPHKCFNHSKDRLQTRNGRPDGIRQGTVGQPTARDKGRDPIADALNHGAVYSPPESK